MLVPRYDELRSTFHRSFDVLIIIRVSGDRMNAHKAIHRLSDKFERRHPER